MKNNNKNLSLLPTDKPSRLYFDVVVKELLLQNRVNVNPTSFPIEKRHIYITNSEEIKEETYFLEPINNSVLKLKDNSDKLIKSIFPTCKKIILTTDQDLIKDGVQAIPDEFLEWFVKNPSCEEVEIKTFEVEDYVGFAGHTSYPTFHNEYKIIIPKEESKQSTKDRIMSETSEETKQKVRDYGNSLVKQTAVEWLEEQVIKFHNWKLNQVFDENCFDEIELNKAIQQAKEMEKEQIIDANRDGADMVIGNVPFITGEQYYNETFNK